MKRFIIYSRKSRTAQDGHTQHTHATSEWHTNNYLRSLDAQGIPYEIVDSYEENISGGGYYTNRPIFNSIVQRCLKDKTLHLLTAKADRMTRNMRTGSELIETINFTLANAPDADDMQKQLEFMIAEREYKNISQRFKDMYQAKAKRCEKSGEELTWGGNSTKWKETYANNKALGLHKVRSSSVKAQEKSQPIVIEIKTMIQYSKDAMKLDEIANCLNEKNMLTSRGKLWTKAGVSRLIAKNNIDYRQKNKRKVVDSVQ